MSTQEEIRDLVSQNKLEQALLRLRVIYPDAVLLQAQYYQGEKQYRMSLIDFSEWSRVQSRISYAILQAVGDNNITIANVNNSTVVINQTVNINFSSLEGFKNSLNQLDLPTLVKEITQELKGKPAMQAWLPILQEYNSFELLGSPIAPGYISEVKEKLIAIYDEFWTKKKDTKKLQVATAVEAIYQSLIKGKTKEIIAEAITDFQVFFYENPGFRGLETMNDLEEQLESPKMKLFQQKRPESYQAELDKIHAELVEISNRLLLNLEK